MSRLKKLAYDKKLYHGTSIAVLKQITEAGMLLPQESEGGGVSEDVLMDQFMEQHPEIDPDDEDAYDRAFDQFSEQAQRDFEGFNFFAADIPQAAIYGVQVSYNDAPDGDCYVVLEADIAESALLPDNTDCTDCKTWQESLQRVDQVKVAGALPDTYIRHLYFFSTKDNKALFDCAYQGWEQKWEEFRAKQQPKTASRLKKVAFGKTLYHGLTLNQLKSVTQDGVLYPNETSGGGIDHDQAMDGFWETHPEYENYDFNDLEQRKNLEDAKKKYIDQVKRDFEGFNFFATNINVAIGYSAPNGGYLCVLEASIPEDAIMPDNTDMPQAKTWQETDEIYGQVKVIGALPDTYFKNVHFFDMMHDEIFECSYQGWEQQWDKFLSEYEKSITTARLRKKADEYEQRWYQDDNKARDEWLGQYVEVINHKSKYYSYRGTVGGSVHMNDDNEQEYRVTLEPNFEGDKQHNIFVPVKDVLRWIQVVNDDETYEQ